ncbi:MAG TPA: iron ABC transporter permease [Candidatus Limnocylindrales bacterium]|nr:iron ABC transporter permease [Candidatus Limnocylindrales bacterium]
MAEHRVPLAGLPRLPWLWAAAGVALLIAAAAVGAVVGPVHVPMRVVLQAVASPPFLGSGGASSGPLAILWSLRFPRVVLAALVGALLAVAGAAYQGVFRNPLADPYLLGAGAGAVLGATIAIVLTQGATVLGISLVPVAAFVGAALAVSATYTLGSSLGGYRNPSTLVLAGVAIAAFFTAVQTYVQQVRSDSLRQVYAWILGRLVTAGWDGIAALVPYAVLGVGVILAHRRLLDALAVGDEEVSSLGVSPRRVRLIVVAAATLCTAAAVSAAGAIGFVGIIVPHTVRLLLGTSYRVVLPMSLLLGAAFLVLADTVARTLTAPAEMPIGVVTAMVGAPFFLFVMRSRRLREV